MATQRCNLPLSYDLESLFDDTESSDETIADMVFSTDAVADHNSRTARPVPRLSNLDGCRSVSSTISVHNAQCRRSVSSTIPVPHQQVSDAVVPCIEGSIQSIQSSRYSATSTASSRLSVRPIGNVLMTPGHNMFTGTDIQPRRTYVTKGVLPSLQWNGMQRERRTYPLKKLMNSRLSIVALIDV